MATYQPKHMVLPSRKSFGWALFAGSVVLAICMWAGMQDVALSAPPVPEGSISLVEQEVAYGDTVHFVTEVSGKQSPKGYLYNQVVCTQGTTVVYQASNMDLAAGFTLADQDGQNLEWDGGAAECQGVLVYRVDGRSPTIEILDSTFFTSN